MDMRLEFVELASREGANKAQLCKRFGISRKTGYKWLGRQRGGGSLSEALGGAVPASRYDVSPRPMPAVLPEAGQWYGGEDVVKKILAKGIIAFRGVLWSIGEAFKGQEVALRQTGEERIEVYYCWKRIAWWMWGGTGHAERQVTPRWRTAG